jgi:hypothetical protein
MRAQARDQGRYLGGRPPDGYRLVDAGPHPNAAHAAWGGHLQRLDPDPATAPHVQWIFAQRLTSRSLAGIARELNERGVPVCGRPWSQHAPQRRPLERAGCPGDRGQPRYTGRQVWNRQHVEHRRGDDGGRIRVQQWNRESRRTKSRPCSGKAKTTVICSHTGRALSPAPPDRDGPPSLMG